MDEGHHGMSMYFSKSCVDMFLNLNNEHINLLKECQLELFLNAYEIVAAILCNKLSIFMIGEFLSFYVPL